MDIDNLTIKEARELVKLVGGSPGRSHSYKIGEKYIIRTVTFHYTGRIAAITDTDIVLDEAAWIADTGRWADALKNGTLNEVEPYPGGCIIQRDNVIDAALWSHDLPRDQK